VCPSALRARTLRFPLQHHVALLVALCRDNARQRRVLGVPGCERSAHPAEVSPALEPCAQRRLNKAAEAFARSPIGTIQCVLFESEEAARHWIELRHTGANEGAGLMEWGSDEKDRFRVRHGAGRSAAGQVLDFVERHGLLSEDAKRSRKGINTNLSRLLNTPRVGTLLVSRRSDLTSTHGTPAKEVAKGLSRIVEDLTPRQSEQQSLWARVDPTGRPPAVPAPGSGSRARWHSRGDTEPRADPSGRCAAATR
jgi:hypothetical protein